MAECVKCHSHNIIESENGFYCCNCGWDSKKEEYVKRINNGDRIRSMSDEDLAEMLMCPAEYDINFSKTCDCRGEMNRNCFECTKKWIQSEVEE